MSKSSTITTDSEFLPNPHPGEILLEEFLKPLELSQNGLARALQVPPRRINEIVLGKRAVTADTDLRLARYFGLSEGFFLGLAGRPRPDGTPPQDPRRPVAHHAEGGVDYLNVAHSPCRWRAISSQPGFIDPIRLSFHCRGHFLMDFSRAIAWTRRSCSSNQTSVLTPYLKAKPGVSSFWWSKRRAARSRVTPV
jgi:addiction module HigA family antidote